MSIERSVRLTCHPAVHSGVVRAIEVRVRRSPDGTLKLAYRLEGDVARLRVPTPQTPRVVERLWDHTCFEAFIAAEGETDYYELNFSPSGEWAVFACRDYRDGELVADESLAPRIELRQSDLALELDATFSLDRLAAGHREAALSLGLSAVIEMGDGTRSYWALRHPLDQPDFHHTDAFALRLDPS